MISIKVNKFLQSAFSNEQAEILKERLAIILIRGIRLF